MKEDTKTSKEELEKVINEKEKEKDSDSKEDFEVIPDDILDGIPIEDRSRIKGKMTQMMFSTEMKRSNPLSEKITSEHISKLIENSNTQDERDRKERKSDKNYQIIFLLIGLIFIGFLIVFLKDDKELLYKVIIAIISFVGGFGIGKTTVKQKNVND